MIEPFRALTAYEIAKVQTELRAALGLPPEEFPVSSFIGMVSDEIEQLRKKGLSDHDIAEMIRAAANVAITAEDISRHYAHVPPAARGRPG